MRLDMFMCVSGLSRSRTHAANLIKLGLVNLNGEAEFKASKDVCESDLICIAPHVNYASLGGIKLKYALDYFKLDVNGLIAIDIGASNGGFTDVLVKNGIAKVFAVDVSECALPPEIKNLECVEVRDKLNARYLSFDDIGLKADIITIDVSFISLKHIFPAILQFMKPMSKVIALIKPQFEVGQKFLTKHGIVVNNRTREVAVQEVVSFANALGLISLGLVEAPHPFLNKNQEYLACLVSNKANML
ncbi:MAG: TlyA family RNA methyltransferase [Christensenellaceae bacterium]|jgi:23S rRNA (cytidine1920-2'-O)/16S rRNA (cytidine1409-2'-O)-methyltransferase|nr:TlyA family RNA methyltransferase [Christensenellaceae bacterium]